MRFFLKITTLLLLMCGAVIPQVRAQSSKKVVTIQITREADGFKQQIDTTLIVNDEADYYPVLRRLERMYGGENTQLEKVIIVRDLPDTRRNTSTIELRDQRQTPAKKSRAMMGVYLDTGHDNSRGVRITSVSRNGAAQEAGLRPNDRILQMGDDRIDSYKDLVEAKKRYEPGDRMRVLYQRDGDRYQTTLTLKGSGESKSTTYSNHNHNHNHNNSSKSYSGPKAFLGVYTDELSSSQARELGLNSQQGILIDGVVPGSGADRAGLKSRDVITSIEGQPLDASFELSDALGQRRPGDMIEINFIREGRYMSTQARLTTKDGIKKPVKKKIKVQKAFLGVNLDNYRGGGVYITSVVRNSAAEEGGLNRGDVIIQMGPYETNNYSDLVNAMKKFRPGQKVRVQYLRNNEVESTYIYMGSKTVEKWVTVEDDRYPTPPPPPQPAPAPRPNFDEDRYDRDNNYQNDYEAEIDALFDQFESRSVGNRIRDYMINPDLDMKVFEFFPNPSDGRFRLRFVPASRGDLQIRIFDSRGREVYQEYIQDYAGEYDKEIDLSRNAARGVYFIQLTQGDRGMVDRLIVR
ncbi:MAG: PDZ domain-containing protein [Bacteroidota bacterium]